MKTLNQSGFFNQGLRARKFVRIGNDILLPATAKLAGTSFDDTVSDFDGISQSIDPAGGLSVVSGAGVRDLILDRELTLCTAVDLTPKYDGVTLGAGRSIRQGSPFEPYSAVRNSTTGAYDSPAIVCGRSYNAGILSHTVYRGVLQFSVPSDVGTCEDAFLELTGAGLSSAASFGVYLFPGTWTALGSGMHNDFTGWASSGNYTIAESLSEAWSTGEYGATTRIRLNAAGRQYLVNMAGQTARIMLVSNRDALWSIYSAGASGNEFVMFGAASALLRMRYNSKTLDNQSMSIYYAIENDGVLPAATSGMDLVWTGVVDSYEIGERTLSLEGRQNDHKKDCLVPRKVITKTDWPDCPEESNGKGAPVVYGGSFPYSDVGAHADGIGYETGLGVTSGLRGYFPSPVARSIGEKYESPWQAVISSHAVFNASFGLVALWNGSQKTYERFYASIGAIQTHANGMKYVELSPLAYPVSNDSALPLKIGDYFGRACSVVPSHIIDYAEDATNPESAYVSGTANYATLPAYLSYIDFGFSQQGNFGEIARAEIVFDIESTGGGVVASLYDTEQDAIITSGTNGATVNSGVAITYFDSAGATFTDDGIVVPGAVLVVTEGYNRGKYPILEVTSDTRLKVNAGAIQWSTLETGLDYKITNAADQIETDTNTVSGTGQKVLSLPGGEFADPSKYRLRIKHAIPGGAAVKLRHVQVRVYSTLESIRTIYFNKYGAVYGAWITGRTGGHIAGELIENPSHVIESFARSEMGLEGTEINTASFDSAATALTGMELAFQLLERKRSRLLLDGIGKDGRVILGYDEADRLKARVLNPTAGFAGRGSDAESQVPRDYHIFTTTGTPAAGVYANHQIIGDLTIRQQDMDEVKNDFVLRYRKNYASNEYAEVLTCDKDATTVADADLSGTTGAALIALCLAAHTRLGTVNTDEYTAEYIRDGATAARLLQHRVEWFSKRRNIIEFTAGISAIMFEPGDFVNVRHDRITDLYGDAVTERKKWMITDIRTDLNRDRITITAIEVD